MLAGYTVSRRSLKQLNHANRCIPSWFSINYFNIKAYFRFILRQQLGKFQVIDNNPIFAGTLCIKPK